MLVPYKFAGVNVTMWTDTYNSFFGKDNKEITPIILMSDACEPAVVYHLHEDPNFNVSLNIDTYIDFDPSVPENIFDLPDTCKQITPQKVIIN